MSKLSKTFEEVVSIKPAVEVGGLGTGKSIFADRKP